MEKLKHPNLVAFILMFIGASFSSEFQQMAYWSLGIFWYWVGAGIAYIATFAALILMVFLNKSKKEGNLVLSTKLIGIIICTLILLWTTFVIIAGQSGM
ncbi:hypothetical protein NIE88_07640 [Sporolactobacillus shoreicorticis]|uniref:Uncharacterized protein n=1 Tax=Sporolactobacillus shoreicorticis TaxID=1923877 RepID=A0ABW5S5S2_9BACL|nr:hypothetical protein [Sporolactobacillus shoreicorticis]MCO7125639.1 hypothetical protein [Sporolactobacillus shoreicorticis]